MNQQHPVRRHWPLILAASLAVLILTLITGGGEVELPGITPQPAWEYLSDRPWVSGDTGWLMVGNEGLPAIDSAFYTGEPISLAGHTYAKGFGCYSPSEIIYDLDGEFQRFEAVIGVTPDERPEPPSKRRVQFLVFADNTKVFESPLLSPEDVPMPVSLSVRGAGELRMVTVRETGAPAGAFCAWADVRVQREQERPSPAAHAEAERTRLAAVTHGQRRQANEQQLRDRAQRVLENVREAAGGALPQESDLPVTVRLPNSIALVSGRTAALVGVSGAQQGLLTVIDRQAGQYVVQRLTAALDFGAQYSPFQLDSEGRAEADSMRVEAVQDAALGEGRRMTVPYAAVRGLEVELTVTLFAQGAGLFLDVGAGPKGERRVAPNELPVRFRYVTAEGGSVYTGADSRYLTNFVRLRDVPVADDGIERRDYMGWSNPLYLYDPEERSGALLAAIDETRMPPVFTLQRDPERVTARLSLSMEPAVQADSAPLDASRAPRLYLEPVRGANLQEAFSRYRTLMDQIAPPPELPDWMGLQWLSWYVYYMEMDEDAIVRQIDMISTHFNDLGPWHIIVDAGWYLAEGLPGAEWRAPDLAKFPHGLRWLVDYAHAHNVKVVLYYSAPYLNTQENAGNWLGLRGIIDQHPEWVIPLDTNEPPIDYVYDFRNPELRAYMARVMADYFKTYGVDGLKLDGLGSAGLSVILSDEGADVAISEKSVEQTLEIYRFIFDQARANNPNAYIESGWLTPTLANRYSHTFRYGDEDPVFSRVYPLPGLAEHIDYTAFQGPIMGQRSNIGAAYGDANESLINRWWYGAALAMGAQVSFSVDLGVLTEDSISAYRALFAPYRPFTGKTRVDDSVHQQVFSTEQADGTRYVGVLNRASGSRIIPLTAADLGLPDGQAFSAYDVEERRFTVDARGLEVEMAPESFRLFVVRTEPGTLWANVRLRPAGLMAWTFSAPPSVPGFIDIYAPQGATLYWDGSPLLPFDEGAHWPGYEQDAQSPLVRVTFPPGGTHTLRVEP